MPLVSRAAVAKRGGMVEPAVALVILPRVPVVGGVTTLHRFWYPLGQTALGDLAAVPLPTVVNIPPPLPYARSGW
jgi:hypothetical protein